jgi:hypothetical protein
MFVIDIEGRGPSVSRNGIVSIGVCVGERTGYMDPRIIEKRRFDILPLPSQVMDPKCKAEFWDKQTNGLLEVLQQHALQPEVAIREFRKYLDHWIQRDPNLYVVCDNPAYDFAFIDYYLDMFGLPTLAYDQNKNFRALHDADSYARGFLEKAPQEQWISNKAVIEEHNLRTGAPETTLVAHLPEDDAESIYRFHYALVHSMV